MYTYRRIISNPYHGIYYFSGSLTVGILCCNVYFSDCWLHITFFNQFYFTIAYIQIHQSSRKFFSLVCWGRRRLMDSPGWRIAWSICAMEKMVKQIRSASLRLSPSLHQSWGFCLAQLDSEWRWILKILSLCFIGGQPKGNVLLAGGMACWGSR